MEKITKVGDFMEKRAKISAVAICAALCMIIICLTSIVSKSFRDKANNLNLTEETVLSQEKVDGYRVSGVAYENDTVYTVGVFEGKVGVFCGEFQDKPAIQTGIYVKNLREIDRKLLYEGITVDDYDEVIQLLEDFNS